MENRIPFPYLGFGLGLRPSHYTTIFEQKPKVDWFEIISENFMESEGRPRANLARIRADYPVVMHGVALSIGTVDPLNFDYLGKLKTLAQWLEPAWISDHLCWTGIAHKNTHDLLPVPYTEEALAHIVSRIGAVQDYLGQAIALENPSTYLEFKGSEIPEAEFFAQIAKRSGCSLLLDVNNVYVSCFNHRLDAKAYLDTLPMDRVIQIHLSGHSNMGTHIIDTHDDHVVDEVWALYRYAVARAGRVPNTMVEWDDNIPEFAVLFLELEKARIAAHEASDQVDLQQLLVETQPYVANQKLLLEAAQTCMQNAVIQGKGSDNDAAEWIRAKPDFAPAAQLEVYQKAYRFRLFDAVAEDFGVLKTYVGPEKLNEWINDFITHNPSQHFNLTRYASRFVSYLATRDDVPASAHEIAQLEDAISCMADPAESVPLSMEHLADASPEALLAMHLQPRTALKLLSFTHDVNAYFDKVVQSNMPADSPVVKQNFLAVFRHENTVWRMPLGALEFKTLEQLFAGKNLGNALEAVEAATGEAAALHIGEWLARWVRNGLLSMPTVARAVA